MKRSSRNLSDASCMWRVPPLRDPTAVLAPAAAVRCGRRGGPRSASPATCHDQTLTLMVACCLSLVAAVGCESLQRKFTRQPTHAAPPPNPIINFQDYSRAMTPLERYQKHYLIFGYWNDTLLAGLQERSLNPKRVLRASEESLHELSPFVVLGAPSTHRAASETALNGRLRTGWRESRRPDSNRDPFITKVELGRRVLILAAHDEWPR